MSQALTNLLALLNIKFKLYFTTITCLKQIQCLKKRLPISMRLLILQNVLAKAFICQPSLNNCMFQVLNVLN